MNLVDFRVPFDYVPLDRVISNGTQRVDTGTYAYADMNLKLTFSIDDMTRNQTIMGCLSTGSTRSYEFYVVVYPSGRIGVTAERKTLQADISPSGIHVLEYRNRTCYLDGVEIGTLPSFTGTSSRDLVLMGLMETPEGTGLMGGIHSFTLDGETWIPARRESDGQVGLLHVTKGTFSETIGTLQAGNEIPNRNDYQVIEEDGTPYDLVEIGETSSEGNPIEIKSGFKTIRKLEVTGNTIQETKDVRVMSVEGYALKYNQLLPDFDVEGYWTTANLNNVIKQKNTITFDMIGVSSRCLSSPIYGLFNKFKDHWYIQKVTVKVNAISQVGAVGIRQGQGELTVTKTVNTTGTYELVAFFKARQEYLAPGMWVDFYTEGFLGNVTLSNYSFIDLTDMFGAGNEPTTLDQFYATPQGKLYHGYVEYGYHILGAGEYKSNQLIRNGDFSEGFTYWEYNSSNLRVNAINNRVEITALNDVTGDRGYIVNRNTLTSADNGKTILIVFDAEVLDWNGYQDSDFAFGWQGSGDYTNYFSHSQSLVKTRYARIIKANAASYRLNSYFQVYNGKAGMKWAFSNIILHKLDDLGLQDLTLDELKSQRPDLFTYQPYHTTETRTGFILSDGTIYPLSAPLYGIGDLKDKGSTNGVVIRRCEIVDGNVVVKATPTISHTAPIITDATIVNESYTETTETSPSPNYPEEIVGTKGISISGRNLYDASTNYPIRIAGRTVTVSGILIRPISYSLDGGEPITVRNLPVTIESDAEYLKFNEPVDRSRIKCLQVEFGTEASPYEPYFPGTDADTDLQEGDKVIVGHKVGKNLIELFKFEPNANTEATINGSSITFTSKGEGYPVWWLPLKLKKNMQYVLSLGSLEKNFNDNSGICGIWASKVRSQDDNPIRITYSQLTQGRTLTFNAGESENWWLHCYLNFTTVAGNILTFNNIQLEEDSTVTPYEPYLKNKVWKYNQMKSVELKSQVKNIYDYNGNHGIYFQNALDATCNRCENSYCTHESKVGEYYGANDHYMWVGANDRNIFWVGILDGLGIYNASKTNGQMLSEFDEWLQANGPIVYYRSNAPEWQDLTDTELGQRLLNAKLNPSGTAIVAADNSGNVVVEYPVRE